MAQPVPYVRRYNFAQYSTSYPSAQQPGSYLDAEFNAIKVTADQIAANLKLIQRDDGGLASASVGIAQLKAEVAGGVSLPTPWVTGKAYALNAFVVVNSQAVYYALVAHTSGVFATDLAAGKWQLVYDASSAVTATGGFVSGSFTGNGAQTVFDLGYTIVAPERVLWIEGGVIKVPGTDYTVSGTTVVRTSAPANLAAISWRLFGSSNVILPGSGTVGTTNLQDASVTTAKLVDQSVATAKLADGGVTLAKLATNSVDSSKIVDGSIATIDLADGLITEVKRAPMVELTLDTSSILLGATGDLSTTTTENIYLTGNDTLAALGVLPAGRVRRLRIAGTPTFVHNATVLPLPASQNFSASPGDVIELLSQGTGNYTVISIKKQSGGTVATTANSLPFPLLYLR